MLAPQLAYTPAPSSVPETPGLVKAEEWSEKEASVLESIDSSVYCSCVLTARAYGVNIPFNTDARDLKPNSPPAIGGLVLLSYPKAEHVATIVALGPDSMKVVEGNMRHCQRDERWIAYTDYHIRGFWVAP